MKPQTKGFVCVPVEVLQAKLSPGALKALAGLLSYRNRKTGQCNPRVNHLCERLGGVPNTTVRRWLRELKKAGVVEPVERPGKSNSYRVVGLSINGQGTLSINGHQEALYPYMNQMKLEPAARRRAAASAAAGPNFVPRKQAGREESTFAVVRESLHKLSREVHMPIPDDDLVRRVITAARGAAGEEIHATLVALWKRGRFQSMRSWGLVPVIVEGCYRDVEEVAQ